MSYAYEFLKSKFRAQMNLFMENPTPNLIKKKRNVKVLCYLGNNIEDIINITSAISIAFSMNISLGCGICLNKE